MRFTAILFAFLSLCVLAKADTLKMKVGEAVGLYAALQDFIDLSEGHPERSKPAPQPTPAKGYSISGIARWAVSVNLGELAKVAVPFEDARIAKLKEIGGPEGIKDTDPDREKKLKKFVDELAPLAAKEVKIEVTLIPFDGLRLDDNAVPVDLINRLRPLIAPPKL